MKALSTLVLAAAALWAAIVAGPAGAQAYPSKPVRIIVPYSAGGNTDVITRHIAKGLAERLGQQVLVENRAGAGSILGTDAGAKAAPDGYTFVAVITAYATNASLYKKLPYGPQDLTPVSMLYRSSVVVATADPAVTSLQDLQREGARRDVNYATSGVGSLAHLLSERYVHAAQLRSVVHVPYKGAAEAMSDLVAGRVTFMFDAISTLGPHLRAGRLRAIAVTGSQRTPALPDVPTVVEQGFPELDAYSWGALLAPAGTPPDIVSRLSSELTAVLSQPELKATLATINAEAWPSTPADAAAFIAADAKANASLIKRLGLSLDAVN